MSLFNGILFVLFLISCMIGMVILLVLANVLTLKKPSNIKILFNALIFSLLAFVTVLSGKYIFSSEHNDWLPNFQDSDSCDKPDRPYWCEIDP